MKKFTRKVLVLLICISSIFTLCSCSKQEETATDVEIEEQVLSNCETNIDLESVFEEVNKTNEENCYLTFDEEQFNEYLYINPDYENLFTKSQINELKKEKGRCSTISLEEALEDVDTMFNLIKYGYGAYNLLGGDEFFDSLKQEIIDELNDDSYSGNFTFSTFERIIFNVMKKVVDSHFMIDNYSLGAISDSNCVYYYNNDYKFYKDDKGYYLLNQDNDKYYFEKTVQNENSNISLTMLLDDGSLHYCLNLLCNENNFIKDDQVVLINENNEEIIKDIKWSSTTNTEVIDHNNPCTYEWLEDDVLYIRMKTFHNLSNADYNTYTNTGTLAKDAKAVIMDYRGNGGGNHKATEDWIKNLTGSYSGLSYLMYYKASYLNENSSSRYINTQKYEPNYVDNDIPVYVLVDKNSASATETSIDLLRSIKNVIVVGSNTGGLLLSGSSTSVYLPNSGLQMDIPADVTLRYDGEIQEAVGIYPDIWIDPINSLKAVQKLISSN